MFDFLHAPNHKQLTIDVGVLVLKYEVHADHNGQTPLGDGRDKMSKAYAIPTMTISWSRR